MTWPPRAAGTGDTRTEDVVWLHVDDAGSAGRVRRVAAEAATDLGLPARSVAELEIAAIELASNLAQHATDGVVLVRRLRRAGGPAGGAVGGVGLVSVDTGPGMPDLARSRRDGHSTAGTLGIGLGAIERLATRMDLHSLPGRGTVLAAEFWPPGVPPGAGTVDGLTRPITGEDTCGDGFAVRQLGDGRTLLLLCDGLGHGPLAATATRVAVDAFHTTTATDPAELVRQLHERLGHTRGAAVGVAAVDRGAGLVRYAGLGNVAGHVVAPAARRTMVSLPGIAGHQCRTVREFDYPLPADAAVVLHSDGLTNRWDLATYPGLLRAAPMVLAAVLLRDAGLRRDDASVLVAGVHQDPPSPATGPP